VLVDGIVEKPWVTFMMEECNIHGVKEMDVYVCRGGVLHDGMTGVMAYAGEILDVLGCMKI